MTKIYLSALAFAMMMTGTFAQSSNSNQNNLPENQIDPALAASSKNIKQSSYNKDLQVEIWSNDFSDPATWTLGHDADVCDLDWQIGTGLTMQGSFADGPITSTTASNGYAMIDSFDYWEENGDPSITDTESSYMTTADPIDLSESDFITLDFEGYFRTWNLTTCFVVISTNNTDWPALTYDYDANDNPNVFALYQNLNVNQATANPEFTQLDISEVAGGQSEVWIRFHWTAESTIYGTGYGWFIDDVAINEVPANNMRMDYGVISHNGTGDEYGRVPADQLNDNMFYSALVTNIGADTQTDVVVGVEVVDENNVEIVNTSTTVDSVQRLEEYFYETEQSQELISGLYTTTFSVSSAEEMDGDLFDNNTTERKFMITDDMYSLDAIGVDDVSTTTTIGTGSFQGSADGFMVMVYYDLSMEENPVYGAEVLLASSTVPGGSVFIHVLDTTDFWNDVFDNPIVSSDEYFITEDDVDAGMVRIYFDSPEMLEANAYYLAIEMYSEDNEFDITLIDDLTTPQPFWSSAILIPPTSSYTNGNAVALRLLTAGPNSVEEIENQAVLSQNVPNPAKDLTTVSFELLTKQNVTVRLTDILGKVVLEEKLGNLVPGAHQYTFELSGLQAGTYHYSIVTDNGSLTKSMQVIK